MNYLDVLSIAAFAGLSTPSSCPKCGAAWPCRQHANPLTHRLLPKTKAERRAEQERKFGKGKRRSRK